MNETPEPTTPNSSPTRKIRLPDRRTLLRLSLVMLIGLGLRLWGIGWSLPNASRPLATYHPDELVNLAAAEAVDIPHLQLDTGFYNYGAFYFYMVSFSQTFGRGYGLIPSTPAPTAATDSLPIAETLAKQAPERAGLFLAGRLVTVLLGVLTIPALCALGTRLYGCNTGMIAALLYAIAPLAVVHAHFLTVDVPATFFVTLTLLWAARLLTEQTWRNYIFCGVWAGLAAATKYNTGLVLIAPIAAHLLNREPEACRKHRVAHFLVMLMAAGTAFIIGCPGPLINFAAFWKDVHYEVFEHSRSGHGLLFAQTGPGWWYHSIVSLPYGLGIPLLLLATAGVVFACLRRTKADWLLLAFLMLYFLTTSLSAVRFARYMIPLFPVFCLLAARLVCEPFTSQTVRRGVQAAGAFVMLFTFLYSFGLVRQMTLPDPRDAAVDYLSTNAPNGASIAFATVPWFYAPPLSPEFGQMDANRRRRGATETTRFAMRIPQNEWDVDVLQPTPDYAIVSDIETMHNVYRLPQPAPVAWMKIVETELPQHTIFGGARPFGMPHNSAVVPEDLLYIVPTVSIYHRARR